MDLAGRNFTQRGLNADLFVMNGECLQFPDNMFDVVYAHGVLQYTADTGKMIAEIHRVLKPGGEAVMRVVREVARSISRAIGYTVNRRVVANNIPTKGTNHRKRGVILNRLEAILPMPAPSNIVKRTIEYV